MRAIAQHAVDIVKVAKKTALNLLTQFKGCHEKNISYSSTHVLPSF
jgi:hypothetical protein